MLCTASLIVVAVVEEVMEVPMVNGSFLIEVQWKEVVQSQLLTLIEAEDPVQFS